MTTATRRTYTPKERAEAVGLGLTIGARAAGKRLNVPYRNVARWMGEPEAQVQRITTEKQVLETMRTAAFEGAADLLRIIRDPKAADRDKVRATEVATDRYMLLSGQATSRSESFNVNADAGTTGEAGEAIAARYRQEMEARAFLHRLEAASDDELREYLASDTGLAAVSAIRDARAALVEPIQQPLNDKETP